MKRAVDILQVITNLSFGLLWIPAAVHWRRNRDRASSRLLVSLGLFGLMTILGRIGQAIGYPRALHDVQIFIFLASGYTLLLLRDAFVPLGRRAHRVVIAATIATGTLTVAARLPLHPEVHLTGGQFGVLMALILVWSGCAAEPAVRFWIAARGRPVVQRARLRAIGVGYGGLVGILLIAVSVSRFSRNPAISLGFEIAALFLAPLLIAGFFPPAWLRRAWREPEEAQLRQTVVDFLELSPDVGAVAERSLGHAVALIGGEAGIIADSSGAPIAVRGIDERRGRALLDRWAGIDEPLVSRLPDDPMRQAVVLPLAASSSRETMILIAGPFTPIFGSDELARLRHHGAAIATALDRARLSAELFRQTEVRNRLLQAMSDLGQGFIVTNRWRVVFSNEACRKMSGYSEDELVALPSAETLLASGDGLRLVLHDTERVDRPWESHFETILRRRDGTSLDVEVSVTSLGNEPGSMIAVFRDITERRKMIAHLREQAMVDSLTRLPNRRAFFALAEDRRRLAQRAGHELVLIFADVDNLKAANDSLGHAEGDAVLLDVAEILKETFRGSDIIARVGGDEFCVLLSGDHDERAATDRLAGVLEHHNTTAPRPFPISISIGFARLVADGRGSIADLVHEADREMYGRKQLKRSVSQAG